MTEKVPDPDDTTAQQSTSDESGDEFTDSRDTSGYICLLRKMDPTDSPLDLYRTEVHEEKRSIKSRVNRVKQLTERQVSSMRKAEVKVMNHKAFHYENEWFTVCAEKNSESSKDVNVEDTFLKIIKEFEIEEETV